MNNHAQAKEIHLYDYLRTIFKWRKPAVILFIAIVFTVAIVSFVMTPVYKGTTRIQIEKVAPRVLNIEDIMPAVDPYSTEFYQTQYKIIQSRSIALRVVRSLKLANNPVFNPAGVPSHGKEGEIKLMELILAQQLQNSYKIEPIRNSSLVDISFESRDPQLAANVANAVAHSYIVQAMESKTNTSQEAKEFLTKQLEGQKKQLEESEQALQAYKEKYGIVSVSQNIGHKESENIAMQRLSGLTANLIQAQAVRVEVESRYAEVKGLIDKGADYETIPQISSNYLIQQLKVQEAQLETQFSEFSQKFGEKHPKMIQLKKEIEGVKQKIKSEARQVVLSLKNELSIARAKENAARGAMNSQKEEAQKLSEHAIQYGVLSREVEKNREFYENLLKRLKETSVAGEMVTTNISIIDSAEVPRGPIKPDKAKNILLSIVAGLCCSVGLVFFLEYLDNTMKTPEDVEKFMKMPCIGVIPAVNFDEIVGKDVPHNEIIAYHKPKSTITEAFRGLRTAILFSFPVNTKKSLLVTSCVPREGKTFIIANLAMVTAYSGESVLLIDADMRKPQIHAIFGLKNEKGLSNYLIGDNMEIHRSVMHENLDVITSGPVPPNPAELLGFKRMISLIEEMKDKYNTIIIDSPPLGSVTDALILSRLVEGVLFVVHGGSTTHDMSRQGATQLRDINARPIGSVLNNIEIGKENHYYSRYYQHYYHYYYYNDYYGDEEDKGKTKSKRRSHDARPSALSLLSKINRGRKDDNGRSSTWAFLRRHTPGNRKKNHKQEL